MRRRHQLLAAVAAMALLGLPAAPAHALPSCGGTWRYHAVCAFDAPASAFTIKGVATSDDGPAEISVRVYVVIGGVQYQVGTGCTNRGPSPARCTAIVDTPFDGLVHYCEVFGRYEGTYLCADPPYLPLPI